MIFINSLRRVSLGLRTRFLFSNFDKFNRNKNKPKKTTSSDPSPSKIPKPQIPKPQIPKPQFPKNQLNQRRKTKEQAPKPKMNEKEFEINHGNFSKFKRESKKVEQRSKQTQKKEQPKAKSQKEQKDSQPKLQQQSKQENQDKKQESKQSEESSGQSQQTQDKEKKSQQPQRYQNERFGTKLKHFILILLGLTLLKYFFQLANNYLKAQHSTIQQLKEFLKQDKVKYVQLRKIDSSFQRFQVLYTNRDGSIYKFNISSQSDFKADFYRMEKNINVQFRQTQKINFVGHFILFFGPLGLMFYILKRFKKNVSSQMGNLNMFRNQVKRFDPERSIKIKFADVAGLDEAKTQISEIVDFLKNPQRYKKLGARIPKGALLTGPPGTGKTMLAKACAGEADVPFFYASGSDFVQMFVGMGASRVRSLFKQAKQNQPSIIFIDQIDAVGKKRTSDAGGGNQERQNTLNQILVQMDGFNTSQSVIVLAATNMKDMLDRALIRPGRFDRSVEIGLPDIEGRRQIFKVHLKPLKLSKQKDIQEYAKRLATLTPGYSGAEIANLCNQAAILAARLGQPFVRPIDFQMANDRIIAGTQRKKIVTQEQRKVVAFHQSGHAVVSWFLQGAYPLLKLTIVPRSKGALGFAQYLPQQSSIQTQMQLEDKICFILGGRCSQQYFFGKVTTGAYDDLSKAYRIAQQMVRKQGMSSRIGLLGFPEDRIEKSYSQQTQQIIDDQIKKIIDKCSQRTRELVRKHEQLIRNMAQALLEKETLNGEQIRNLLGQRPFKSKESYREYLEETAKS